MGAVESELPDETLDHEPDGADEASSSPQVQQPRFRYRITYSKEGSLRYTSQLDLARIWERTLRRAGLALVYSQGFNPRPKIQLAVGLPLGYASRCEIVDAWLVAPIENPGSVVENLNAASPRGLVTAEVRQVETSEPSLQTLVWSTSYAVGFRKAQDAAVLTLRVDELLLKAELWRDRRDKRVDLRPLIDHLRVVVAPDTALEMELAASPDRGTARPDEVLSELGLEPADALVVRTSIRFRPDAQTG